MITRKGSKGYVLYEIMSLSSKYRYYGFIKGVTPKEWYEVYDKVLKTKVRSYIVDEFIKPRTIDKPEQYIYSCQPLYRDIIVNGVQDFKLFFIGCDSYSDDDNDSEFSTWIYRDRIECCKKSYNKLGELECKKNITGIKCIETGIVYTTPGKAAKAVGLKDKSSIIKVLNEPFRTAAKYHWIKL